MCQIYPGSRWLMGRSKLKTLKETTLNTFLELVSDLKVKDQFHYNAQSGVITHLNGSEILLKDLFHYPADPNYDSLGSLEICGAFIDECNQITYKAWQTVKSRMRYKLKEFGITPKILGSCNPAKNWTYKLFYKGHKDKNLPKYRRFIQALPTDNPHLPPSYLEALLQMEANQVERLYYGNWEYDDDPSALMPFNKITDLFSNRFADSSGENYITADIARFGSDKTIIGVWSGWWLTRIITIDKNKVTEAAKTIQDLATEYIVPTSNIVVDDDGVGGGVTDIVGCVGFVNNSSPLENPETGQVENFNNLKSQCYFKLAEMVNSNKMYIAETLHSDTITQELEQVKQHNMDKDGKKQIVPKDKVKELLGRSPDFSDMLMMRCYFVYRPAIEFIVA